MANGDKKANIEVTMKTNVVIDEKQVEQQVDKVDKVMKNRAKNGYIKLPVDIDYKYPKQKITKSGLVQGPDYSKLQKAQDELIASWNKLSKQGFSSPDEDILNVLKAFRHYQNTAKKQYEGKPSAEAADKTLSKLRHFFNIQITRQFSRLLGDVDLDRNGGNRGVFTRTTDNKLYEKYAKEAIRKNKAAQAVGIDLSQDTPLTKEDKAKIFEYEQKLAKDSKIEEVMAEKKYELKHAKEMVKANNKRMKQLEKERKITSKNAIPIIPSGEPLDEVTLTATNVENLATPKEDTRTTEEKMADKIDDKRTIKGFERGAPARKFNTPHNEINLAYRQQMWKPDYLTKDLLQKMERGGTYVGSNSLLRQTAAALPEEIKKSIKSLTITIDKDKALSAFTTFSETDKKQWSDLANQIGMDRLLLTNVAKVQGALMAGKEGITPEDLKNAITVAVANAVEHGNSQIAAENYKDAITAIGNMLANRYDNTKDAIGGTDGEGVRGVGVNYEEVVKTLKEVFADFEVTSKELIKRAVKEFPEFYNEGGTKQSEKKESDTVFNRVFNSRLKEQSDKLSNMQNTAKRILNHVVIGNDEDSVANDQQEVQSKELNTLVEEDANSGYNTDQNVAKTFGHQITTNRLTGSVKDLLQQVLEFLSELGNNIRSEWRRIWR